jgi:hypothetical protein
MISARVYNQLGELILVTGPDEAARGAQSGYFDKVYPDWATIIVTREVTSSAGVDVDAIWENLVSIHHRDGEKRAYGN